MPREFNDAVDIIRRADIPCAGIVEVERGDNAANECHLVNEVTKSAGDASNGGQVLGGLAHGESRWVRISAARFRSRARPIRMASMSASSS